MHINDFQYKNKRVLVKENNDEIDISNECIVQYKVPTNTFIGRIECPKIINSKTIGIYIRPLFIKKDSGWHKIINYKEPTTKYFLYPHLLVLPGDYMHSNAIYSLDTVQSISELPDTELTIDWPVHN
jgi:hypothetical protein